MMTCAGLLAVATVILLVGSLLILALIPTALAVFLLAVVLTIAGIIVVWRWIYPWLLRMGRWAAQLRNIIFLFIVVVVGELVLKYILDRAGISVPTVSLPILGREVTVIGLGVLCFALFLLLLGLVVWLVRGWRYTWPPARDVFWDSCFRIAALFWNILVGIPLGIVWFFYHPPVRWLVAALLFYLRGISAAAAWLLYNLPLKGIAIAVLFVTRLIARVAAWLLYSLPVRWVVGAVVFILRLMARLISTVIYGIWSWWPIKGIRGTLRKGLTAQSKSYQDYKYA